MTVLGDGDGLLSADTPSGGSEGSSGSDVTTAGSTDQPLSSRREQRKAQTRQRLLDAASELFVEQGFEQTTFDHIAQRARVARQTAFNYFPKKEDFVFAYGRLRRQYFADVLEANSRKIDSAISRLVLSLGAVADFYEHNAEVGRVYTIAWVKSGGPVTEERALAGQFADVLTYGQRRGEIRSDIDADVAGQLIRAAYFDALWAWAAPQRPPDARPLFAEMLARIELILTGLCPPADQTAVRQALTLAQALESTRTRPSQL